MTSFARVRLVASAFLLQGKTLAFAPAGRPMTSTTAGALATARPAVASASTSSVKKKKKSLFLFDFDGVVCDSCDECTISALRTCRQMGLQPDLLADTPDVPPAWLMEKMREIRPAIEVGWQIPVLLMVYLEQQRQAEEEGGVPAMSTAEIIADYQRLVDDRLARWGKTEADMVAAFGGVRDAWIEDDLPSWLDANPFYPGVPAALSGRGGDAVVVTTKQQRFATALVRHAGVTASALPDDRVYGLGMYRAKADVVHELSLAGGVAPERCHFFEDRWPTLAKCLGDDRLKGVNLYLCAWGYCTAEELALGEAEPRVTVIDLDDFASIVTGEAKEEEK